MKGYLNLDSFQKIRHVPCVVRPWCTPLWSSSAFFFSNFLVMLSCWLQRLVDNTFGASEDVCLILKLHMEHFTGIL